MSKNLDVTKEEVNDLPKPTSEAEATTSSDHNSTLRART